MPKLRVPPEQKMDRALTSAIVRWQELTGNDYRGTALALGGAKSTYYSRMKDPGKFTLEELRRMVRKGVITPEDVLASLEGSLNAG